MATHIAANTNLHHSSILFSRHDDTVLPYPPSIDGTIEFCDLHGIDSETIPQLLIFIGEVMKEADVDVNVTAVSAASSPDKNDLLLEFRTYLNAPSSQISETDTLLKRAEHHLLNSVWSGDFTTKLQRLDPFLYTTVASNGIELSSYDNDHSNDDGEADSPYHTVHSSLATTNSDQNSSQPLKFLLLGDWGKGGNDGDFTAQSAKDLSITNDDDEDASSSLPHDVTITINTTTSSIHAQPFAGTGNNKNSNSNNNQNQRTFTYQAAIARAMAEYSADSSPAPSFVVALGDNFYTHGVDSTIDSLWDSLWKEVYLGFSQLSIPWYAVLGNHDYGYGSKGVDAQIARTESGELWKMPSTNYTARFEIPSGGSVQIVFIDTTTLAPSENKCCNNKGGISSEVMEARVANQVAHIRKMLQAARDSANIDNANGQPSWLIVAGHYPIYSSGEHGDISELLANLLPLLIEFGVDCYFSGHDHISEHLSDGNIHYFVAGAGAMVDQLGSKPSMAQLVWSGTGYSAFGAVTATEDALTVEYVNIHGEVVYSYTIEKTMSYHYSWGTNSSGTTDRSEATYLLYKGLLLLAGLCTTVVLVVSVDGCRERLKSRLPLLVDNSEDRGITMLMQRIPSCDESSVHGQRRGQGRSHSNPSPANGMDSSHSPMVFILDIPTTKSMLASQV
eukprot:gene1341-2590_t